MRLPLSLFPIAVMLSAAAHAQFDAVQRRAPRTGQETFPVVVPFPAAPVGGSDACATPDALGGATGSIAYNLVGATTGTEGQTSFTGGLCNHGCAEYGTGQVAVLNDVWFSWTAPASGRVRITTCPVQNDTKIAVYSGLTCPTGTSCLACSDDFHFSGGVTAGLLDSILFFDATLGDTFLIQVGKSSFAGAIANFAGNIDIDVNPAHSTTGVLDDNLAEADIGAGAATAGNLGINRLANVGDTTTLSGVRICFGFPGSSHVNGTAVQVGLWTDPNSDGNPTDGLLVESVSTTVQNANTDTFVDVPFATNHTLSGIYFIGYGYQRLSAANFPLTLDNSTCDVQPDTAWTVINTGAPANLSALGANSTPPARLQTNCQAQSGANNGLWRSALSIRPIVVTGPPPLGTAECFGDGTGAACPCTLPPPLDTYPNTNTGAPGHGCASSTFAAGALLTATGVAVDSPADTVTLTCSSMAGPGVFIQSDANVGSPISFGDGILCSAVNIKRLGVVFPVGGTAMYPSGPLLPIHTAGAPVLTPTTTKHYQVWYRDAIISFCPTGNTYNMSNGLSIVWM